MSFDTGMQHVTTTSQDTEHSQHQGSPQGPLPISGSRSQSRATRSASCRRRTVWPLLHLHRDGIVQDGPAWSSSQLGAVCIRMAAVVWGSVFAPCTVVDVQCTAIRE